MMPITLNAHLATRTAPDLARLIGPIGDAAQLLAKAISRAALAGHTGVAGSQNTTGDNQKKLDVFANDLMVDALRQTGVVAMLVSEELDDPMTLATGPDAQFVVCMDPLDGSSNTDVNGALGTIFGVWRVGEGDGRLGPSPADLIGSRQVAAGYVLYGTGTILVYATPGGVNGFTLDPETSEFGLSHPDLQCPAKGKTFSVNLGNYYAWDSGVQGFVDALIKPGASLNGGAKWRPYSLRYSGALVADLHRTLLEGGVYFYPSDPGHPDGKLRLLYECAPLSYVAQQAGGLGTAGSRRTLDIAPMSWHQRTPIAIGSRHEVELFERQVAPAALALTSG